MQLELALLPRERGTQLGAACLDKAERVADFDAQGAGRFIVGWLSRHGTASGEDLTQAARDHGYRPHDGRAFGPIFTRLLKANQIRVLRSDLPRKCGHGTSGGRLYGVVR